MFSVNESMKPKRTVLKFSQNMIRHETSEGYEKSGIQGDLSKYFGFVTFCFVTSHWVCQVPNKSVTFMGIAQPSVTTESSCK